MNYKYCDKLSKLLFIFFLFSFALLFDKVHAYEIVNYGDFTKGTWTGGTGAYCSGSQYICWNSSNVFFRLTLIDSNGKKVAGTKSVNIAGNRGDNYFKPSGNFKNYNYRSVSTPSNIEHKDYLSYKFSDGNDNTVIDGISSSLIYDERFPSSIPSFQIFKNQVLSNLDDKSWPFINMYGTTEYISFFELFLHQCGYLGINDRLDSYSGNLAGYFILAEPCYPMWYKNGSITTFVYGTNTELVKFVKANSSKTIFTNHIKNLYGYGKAAAIQMCIGKMDAVNLKKSGFNYFSDANEFGVDNCTGAKSYDDYINKGYGINISAISNIVKTLPPRSFYCAIINKFGKTQYWGKDYLEITGDNAADIWKEQCEKQQKYTCKIIDGKYWGKNSTLVDKDTYNVECLHRCQTISSGSKIEYWGSNYTVVSEYTWKEQCLQQKYTCEIVSGEYWGRNSTKVSDYRTWLNECGSNSLSFEMYSCDNNGGKISLGTYDDFGFNFNKSFLKVKGQDENQSVYCYDTVEYNFSDTISDLNKDTFSYLSFVNPRSSHVNITRHCLVNKDATYEINDFKNDISDYKNSNIKINFYNEDYIINPKIDESSFTKLVRNDNYDGNGGKYVEYSFTMTYEVPKNKLYIGANLSDGASGSISLVDWKNSFGKSKELLHSLFTYYTDADFLEDDGYVSSDYTTCHFDYDVVNEDIDIQFRIISLENPFPARDGSSRMPSNIWLNEKNNVFEYITNNRGIRSVSKSDNVSPETMYSNTEPMYRIVLTPSTMMKIREYNKKYSYYSMFSTNYTEEGKETKAHEKARAADKNADKLICDEEGMQCYSQFLRDSKYIPQDEASLNGDCLLIRDTKDDSKIRSAFNSYINYDDLNLNVLIQSLDNGEKYSDSRYDLNYNNRSDADDYHILALYGINKTSGEAQKNTSYYTCANKSFLSGGPEESEGK